MAQNLTPRHTRWLMFLLSILLQNSILKISAQVTASSLVYEGYPVQLLCACRTYDTTWKYFANTRDKQGELINRYENVIGRFSGHFNVESNGSESLSFLTNGNVSVQDAGYYKCYCGDKNMVSETLLQVVPNGYPKCFVQLRDSKPILEYGRDGQNIILSCNSGFDSNYPTMRWLREKTQLPIAYSLGNNNVLRKDIKLTENDEDVTYTCILGNGNVVSAPSCSVMPLRYRPRVNINPKVAVMNFGGNVTFNCSVSFEKNKPGLSDVIYDWNDTIQDQFSGRFVLGKENRSLQLLDLKDSDDLTAMYCRVTITQTGAQDKAVALLRVNEPEMNTTSSLEPYTSTQTHSTSFIHTHSTPVTLHTPQSELVAIAATLEKGFYIYLGISLIIVFVSVVMLCVYKLHKRPSNTRDGLTSMLSVKYEEIKPKAAVNSKSKGQIVGLVKGRNSSQYEEVPDYELNSVTSCRTDMINSEKYGRNMDENEDSPANREEEENELIKSESPYTHIDETKFTEISQPLSDPSSGSARAGERTRDTSPVYATVNKT